MIDVKMLNDDIIRYVAYNLDYTEEELVDKKAEILKILSEMSIEEVFERYLTWQGIIGYGKQISNAYESIKAAEKYPCEPGTCDQYASGEGGMGHCEADVGPREVTRCAHCGAFLVEIDDGWYKISQLLPKVGEEAQDAVIDNTLPRKPISNEEMIAMLADCPIVEDYKRR